MAKPLNIVLILLIALTLGCEKDDICAEATATTPQLIIRFYDASTPEETKAVRRLSVKGQGQPDGLEVVTNRTTDSIALPLKFQKEGVETITRFELKKNADYDTDSNNNTVSNTDLIEISYTPKFVYVSRACGYKSIFENIKVAIIEANDSDVWIKTAVTTKTNIEDETKAHIAIHH